MYIVKIVNKSIGRGHVLLVVSYIPTSLIILNSFTQYERLRIQLSYTGEFHTVYTYLSNLTSSLLLHEMLLGHIIVE